MEINKTNGATPREPNREAQNGVTQQQSTPLSSIFEQNSDGGEEITQNEYDQLSPEDKSVVDGWIWSVHNYLGKGAPVTKSNIELVLKKEIAENAEFNQHASISQAIKEFSAEHKISQGELLFLLKCNKVDYNHCTKEELVEALNNIVANLQETEPEPREK